MEPVDQADFLISDNRDHFLVLSADEMRVLRHFLNNDSDSDADAIDALAYKLDAYLTSVSFK